MSNHSSAIVASNRATRGKTLGYYVPYEEQIEQDKKIGWCCNNCEKEIDTMTFGNRVLCPECISNGIIIPEPKKKTYIKYKYDFILDKWV
jgi:DNA-directed RNA polymerase subunit RPC12/RpoP